MPKLVMLVGLPGSGKTVWRNNNIENDPVILSTDNYIENKAKQSGERYNECFKKYIKEAEISFNIDLNMVLENDRNIIWDQTNLSVKSRKKKLSKIPNHYYKEAIVFLTSEKIIDSINEERKKSGRDIPIHILKSMKENFQYIFMGKNEGFDKVTTIYRNE